MYFFGLNSSLWFVFLLIWTRQGAACFYA